MNTYSKTAENDDIADAAAAPSCSTRIHGGRVTLESPAFGFTLDAGDGLRTVAWENRLTGRTLGLGKGPEVAFDIGLPDQPLVTPRLRVTGLPAAGQASAGEAVFTLEADEPAARVTVTYRWNAVEPVLHKFVTIENRGGATWNRLLSVRLGDYATGTATLAGGELQVAPSFRDRAHRIGGLQGFPVYAESEFFLSLAHPAGWATQEPGKVSLRHYPGAVLILGDPWKAEPYGYSCSDGRCAFLAINNGTWEDRTVTLDLGPAWGLEANGCWNIYRWYPNPARLVGGPKGFRGQTQMAMRPFEVVLLEIVPRGEALSLSRAFRDEAIPAGFAEASCPVPVRAAEPGAAAEAWTVSGRIPASAAGGTFAVALELADESGHPVELGNLGSFFAAAGTVAGKSVVAQPALGPEGYPSSWQTWRIAVPPGSPAQSFSLRITDLPGKSSWMNGGKDASRKQRRFSAHFVLK